MKTTPFLPEDTNKLYAFLADYVRAYDKGHFDEVV